MTITPLSAAAFQLHGFSDPTSFAKERIRSCGLLAGYGPVEILHKAVFDPGGGNSATASIAGGVFTADGQIFDGGNLRRLGGKIIAAPSSSSPPLASQVIDDEVVYLGWQFTQFGHMLLETMARARHIAQCPSKTKFVLHNPQRVPLSGLAREIFAGFGARREQFLEITEPTRFTRLTCPPPLYELQYAAHPDFAIPFVRMGGQTEYTPSTRPLYISRSKLGHKQRHILGEEALENLLRKAGFDIAYPETLPLKEQIRLFRNHRNIVAAAGSAVHSVLFSDTQPRLHLLTEGQFSQDFFLCSTLAGAPTAVVKCLDTGGREALINTPARIQFDILLPYLQDAGLLARDADLTVTPVPDQRLEDEWLASKVLMASIRRATVLDGELLHAAADRASAFWPLAVVLAMYSPQYSELVPRARSHAERETDASLVRRFRSYLDELS